MRAGFWAAAFLLFFFATGASADTPLQQPAPAGATISTNQPPLSGASLASGRGNNCAAKYYPAMAIRLNHEGNVVVVVHIDDKGNVTGADIGQSSGWPELDDAAKQCVTAAWHFIPAMQNGKPVASTKQYRIVWKLTDPNYRPWLKMDPDGYCNTIFASAKDRWPKYQSAILQFRVSATGVVELPFVAISSGDELFDAKAVACMSKLVYAPGVLNGAAADISWSAAVNWSPHTGIAFSDGAGVGLYCPDSDFPANAWNGDPPSPTDISVQITPLHQTTGLAIERESGNAELDRAALLCVEQWRPSPYLNPQGSINTGYSFRFNWREGYAFVLSPIPGDRRDARN